MKKRSFTVFRSIDSLFRLLGLTGLGWLGISLVAQAQDAQFSQYTNAPLALNPSLVGLERGLLFTANYRSQWSSVAAPYTTSQFTGTYPLYTRNTRRQHWGGLGISLLNDRAAQQGSVNIWTAHASLAYNLPRTPNGFQVLSVGL